MTQNAKDICELIVNDYQQQRKKYFREELRDLDQCVKDIERRINDDADDEEITANHIRRLAAAAASLSGALSRYSKELEEKQKSVRPE